MCNNPLKLKTIPWTMLLAQSQLNMDTKWNITMRHSQMHSTNTPPMTRKCIPLSNLAANGSITLLVKTH